MSSSITECGTAAQEMGVGGLVYGVLFDPTVLPLLDQVKDFMSEAIADLAQAADSISANLKKNSDTYAAVETFLTSHFGAMSTDTEGPR